MKAGKITAKLRDAVPVCLMVNGAEVGRYKNIELPDEIKALPIMDFGFSTSLTGKFDFNLHFDEGVLPEKLPEVRAKITRAEKRAAKAAAAAMKGEALAARDAVVETIAAGTPEATEVEASKVIDAEASEAQDAPVADAADEPQPDAPAEVPEAIAEAPAASELVEPVAETPKKRRGRPMAAEKCNEQHSA